VNIFRCAKVTLSYIVSQLIDSDLTADATKVQRTLATIEREVQIKRDGVIFTLLMRIRPYRTVARPIRRRSLTRFRAGCRRSPARTICSRRRTGPGAEFKTLACQQLAPYLSNGDARLELDGPAVVLDPEIATSLALILHELATNASKYGAFSLPAGSVSLTWRVNTNDASPRLHIT
jgi:hypothetical protein